MCALLSAVVAERIFQIKLLLADGAFDMIDQVDGNGQTALIKACLMKTKWKGLMVTKLLVKHDAKLGVTDKSERTCLTYACMTGKEMLVKVLLDTGDMAPNTRDIYGYTNLMHSVLSRSQTVVTIMLGFFDKYKLSLDGRTKNGFTAYMLALKFGYFEMARILEEYGASTETFDFVNFKNSEDWARLSCKNNSDFERLLQRRSKTASRGLRQQYHDINSTTVRQRSQTGSLLSSIKEKDISIKIYHDPYVKSTPFNETSTMFKQAISSTAKQKNAKKDTNISTLDIPPGEYFVRNSSDGNERIKRRTPNQNRKNPTTATTIITNIDCVKNTVSSIKTMLGVLLNESMLSRIQHQQDQNRLNMIVQYKRGIISNSSEILPSISPKDGGFGENGTSPVRCHSSISNRDGRKERDLGMLRMRASR